MAKYLKLIRLELVAARPMIRRLAVSYGTYNCGLCSRIKNRSMLTRFEIL
jgi:hypothetical protein